MLEHTALILGSGFGELVDADSVDIVETAYGKPSAPLRTARLGGRDVPALSRHGDEHTIPPHRINYRANIALLHDAGYTSLIALNTVGVLTPAVDAGQVAVPDQLIDYTWGRDHTFHTGGDAGVEHVEFTEPFPAELRQRLLAAARRAGVECHDGGVYAATQGPRLESAAEVDRLERDGADFIGMTAMPEAVLAAERGMNYACLALAVNKAAGRGDGPIHADIAASSAAARAAALGILNAFFAAT